MALKTLDTHVALVAIDLQSGIVANKTTPPSSEVVAHAATLARAFRARGLPVIWVNVSGGAPGRTDAPRPGGTRPAGYAELVPELGVQPEDHRVTKMQPGAFTGTPLDQILRRRNITQIVLVGISTSNGVEATARAGYDHGYNVAFVTDAMADRDAAMHQHAIEKVFPRMGECTLMKEILERLEAP